MRVLIVSIGSIFSVVLIMAITNCDTLAPSYTFPTQESKEIEKICDIVFRVQKREFYVDHGYVRVPNINSDPLPNVRTTIADGPHVCGRYDSQKLPCFEGRTLFADGGHCNFIRK